MVSETNKELIRSALPQVIVGFVAVLVILGLFLFGAVEQEEYMTKSMFYFGFGALLVVSMMGITILSVLTKMGVLKEESWAWANLFVHDPDEDGALGKTFIRKYLTVGNVIHLSIVLGLIMAIFSSTTNTFFFGLPAVEYQVTETGKLILATEPAVTMETLYAIFILGFLVGMNRLLARRFNLSDEVRILLNVIAVPLMFALSWVAIHLARYGAEETSLLATAFFGYSSALICVIIGSIIPMWIIHWLGNFFQKAIGLFSNEITTPLLLILLLIYIVFVVVVKMIRKKG